MFLRRSRLLLALLTVPAACDEEVTAANVHHMREDAAVSDAEPNRIQISYWHDMVPLFEQHCLQCHREGGIAPFRLDDYATAAPLADLIAHTTGERSMPPWYVTSDGSCGTFADSAALSDDEIALIAQWANAGAPEGRPESITIPDLPELDAHTQLTTPQFVPEIAGGELAEFDEYRCFALEPPADSGYITAYDVLPGNHAIVHHVAAFIVDPEAMSEVEDEQAAPMTNRERIATLAAESPTREGWPCFGTAGEGVRLLSSPVIWAPGQGIVRYPERTGVPISNKHMVVIQVHYNLSDPKLRGSSDQTRVRLEIQPDVDEVAMFALEDPLLATLFDAEPTTLPAHEPATTFRWTRSARDIGMPDIPEGKLYGVMPHMHALGRKYELTITQPGDEAQCAARVDHWDFHWQRMYFYKQPYIITGDTELSVTCEYDTTSVNEPVRPGWGTRNEMCLATLFFAVPRATYERLMSPDSGCSN